MNKGYKAAIAVVCALIVAGLNPYAHARSKSANEVTCSGKVEWTDKSIKVRPVPEESLMVSSRASLNDGKVFYCRRLVRGVQEDSFTLVTFYRDKDRDEFLTFLESEGIPSTDIKNRCLSRCEL